MGYKPKQLGHINIFVRNAERARDWYEDLLGAAHLRVHARSKPPS